MLTAENVARALGGRKVGAAWMARCPAHDDRAPSLSIATGHGGKVLMRCHAGCDQRQVIAALRACGVWQAAASRASGPLLSINSCPPAEHDRRVMRRTAAALAIWQSCQPVEGGPVQTYLRSRGLDIAPPASLRFNPALKHPSGAFWPAMVALVTHGVDATPIGIHRTFLDRNGNGKAPVDPQKMMLGPCRGGAVQLGSSGKQLMIAEGVETALSAMQATGQVAWAALSTSGLRTLELPTEVSDVIVLADGDDAGEAAARDCALCWKRQGRRVRIARPPRGMDFNDMLGCALRRQDNVR
jgi:putative DNA primase/helicase